ncbi:uncharacterized protein [Physcomitrium patens]|uniref:uncharacterized protein isoform X3 n=1 Tax=Physcomitrium patens TaxID=3218 RepID=UPI003CCDA36B
MDTNATPDHSAMSPSPQQQQELISSQLHCASFRRFAGAGVAGHHHAEANLAQIRQDWMSNRVVYVSRRSERLIGEACLADICPMKYHLPFCLRDWCVLPWNPFVKQINVITGFYGFMMT